jgi:hypothetical protein
MEVDTVDDSSNNATDQLSSSQYHLGKQMSGYEGAHKSDNNGDDL